MEQDIYRFCRGQMGPDEYVLWQGQPEPKGNLFSISDLYNFFIGAFFSAFAIYWMVNAAKVPGSSFFFLFGLPFLGIGLYLSLGRALYTVLIRKRTAYVITNKRIYRLRGRKTDNLSASNLPDYDTVCHRNGNGTIRFIIASPSYHTVSRYGRATVRYFTLDNLTDMDRAVNAIARMDRAN